MPSNTTDLQQLYKLRHGQLQSLEHRWHLNTPVHALDWEWVLHNLDEFSLCGSKNYHPSWTHSEADNGSAYPSGLHLLFKLYYVRIHPKRHPFQSGHVSTVLSPNQETVH